MPNNARTQADGTWIDGYTPPKSDWEDLERKIFHSWNGDRGGAYAPPPGVTSGSYTFGGSLGAPGMQITGPTRLTYGGAIRGAATAFVIRTGTWPTLSSTHAGSARSIVQALDTFISTKPYLWSRNHAYGGIGSVGLSIRGTNDRTIVQPEFYAPLRVIDGSTLSQVTLTFRVAQRRRVAPVLMPKMRVLRIPRDSVTDAPEPLLSTTDGLGFDFLPLVTSPDAWYLDGAAQTFTYVCDQNNEIDVENYSYVVHVVEEVGTIDPDETFDGIRFVERKADVKGVVLSTATLSGAANIDGYIISGAGISTSSQRALVVDPDSVIATGTTDSNSTKNGLWTSAAGTWTRAEDLDGSDDFSPNWIVIPREGSQNARACWQCQYPGSSSPINIGGATASVTKTQIRMVPAEPKGNIYHSVKPTFTVADLRFQ